MRALILIGLAVGASVLVGPQMAVAAPPGTNATGATSQKQDGSTDKGDKSCKIGPIPTLGPAKAACEAAGAAKDAVTGVPGQVAGEVAGAVSGSVFDQMTRWATEAASWLTGQIATAIERTSTPELGAGWYRQRFASMAALGLGLALLVAMVALGSAALRRDPGLPPFRWTRVDYAAWAVGVVVVDMI